MSVILHFCTRYLRGGSESRIRDMMRAVPEVDHHLVVGAESDLALARQQMPAVKIEIEPSLRREINPVADIRCVFKLRGVIRRADPALVVTHQSKAGAVGRVAAWSSGVPVVHSLSMASFGPGYPKYQDLLFRIVERGLAPITTGYLVVGRDLAARFTALGIPEGKFRVVRSGVRSDHSEESADAVKRRLGARHDVSDDMPWVVYVGSLEERKKVRDLPRLIEDLVKGLPDGQAHLFVVGEGPQADQVMSEAAARGVTEQITLTGYADDAVDYIRAADVVVLLSAAEGLPQVLVQAGAVGTPWVAYFVDGVQELIDLGASGSIVTPGDVPALVEEIRRHFTGVSDTRGLDLGSWAPGVIERGYRSFFRDLVDFCLI